MNDISHPDDRLLEDLRRNPDEGLRSVAQRYEARLRRHAAAILGDADCAKDVVQECLLRLLAESASVRSLSSWLHRVTHHLALDALRKEKRMRELHLAAVADMPSTSERADRAFERKEAEGRLARELDRLTPNQRAVIELKIKEGLSYKEIAEITGLSSSNVGYLLHHGLKALSENLRAARVEN